ncbi:MAG: hypothetical protein IJ324_07830 [Lachnospiraceae bacterium]|nr:hypothetical protein [Lachnospiraceae bacterium]
MKKLKIFLMMAALSVALCACGGKETEQNGGSDNGNNTVVEQTAGDDKEDKSATEDKKPEHFECLPELLEASPEDRLVQIGDVVLRFDGTMSFKEAMEAFENSSAEYELKTDNGDTELSMDRMVPGMEGFAFEVMKDGETIYFIGVENTSTELATATDDSIILCDAIGNSAYKGDDISYFKGIRRDGNGLTINSVKELMAEYEDSLEEKSSDKSYTLIYSYTWQTPERGRGERFCIIPF